MPSPLQAYRANQAAFEAARSEILLPEEQGFLEPEGLERSYHFKQEEIKDAVDVSSSRKVSRRGPSESPSLSRCGSGWLLGWNLWHLG